MSGLEILTQLKRAAIATGAGFNAEAAEIHQAIITSLESDETEYAEWCDEQEARHASSERAAWEATSPLGEEELPF
jgi:hypothetical protein